MGFAGWAVMCIWVWSFSFLVAVEYFYPSFFLSFHEVLRTLPFWDCSAYESFSFSAFTSPSLSVIIQLSIWFVLMTNCFSADNSILSDMHHFCSPRFKESNMCLSLARLRTPSKRTSICSKCKYATIFVTVQPFLPRIQDIAATYTWDGVAYL